MTALRTAANTAATECAVADKSRQITPGALSALEVFALNFVPPSSTHIPDAAAELAESTRSATTGVEVTQEPLDQEECTAVIFGQGALGLEFVQQADRVVVSAVRPGSLAAQLPFPKIQKGMQLVPPIVNKSICLATQPGGIR